MPNNFRHEAIIDLILMCPKMTKGEIALELGYTQSWLSILMNSDAFQLRLAERRSELSANISEIANHRMEELDEASHKVIKEELEKSDADPHYALRVQQMIAARKSADSKGKGMMQMHANNMQIVNNNTTISKEVLQRAQNKLRSFAGKTSDDDSLVAEVLP